MRLEDQRFDLAAVLADVVAMVDEPAREKGLALRIDTADLPRWVRGDALRLRQALLNYISNAVKFTEYGSIVLTAQVVSSVGADIAVLFSVADTGVGIAANLLGQIFEPFEQADVSIARRYGGTGLGLAITRRLAELMGGEVGVQSQLGLGSTFWLTVHLHTVADAADPTEAGTDLPARPDGPPAPGLPSAASGD
jgi:signal transduction histidine kinase